MNFANVDQFRSWLSRPCTEHRPKIPAADFQPAEGVTQIAVEGANDDGLVPANWIPRWRCTTCLEGLMVEAPKLLDDGAHRIADTLDRIESRIPPSPTRAVVDRVDRRRKLLAITGGRGPLWWRRMRHRRWMRQIAAEAEIDDEGGWNP